MMVCIECPECGDRALTDLETALNCVFKCSDCGTEFTVDEDELVYDWESDDELSNAPFDNTERIICAVATLGISEIVRRVFRV